MVCARTRDENPPLMFPRGTLSEKDRLAYINAVLCLQSKPPISPYALVPGARSRYDDFQSVHINQTMIIHNNVSHPISQGFG